MKKLTIINRRLNIYAKTYKYLEYRNYYLNHKCKDIFIEIIVLVLDIYCSHWYKRYKNKESLILTLLIYLQKLTNCAFIDYIKSLL